MAISLTNARRPPLHVLLFCLGFALIVFSFNFFRDSYTSFSPSPKNSNNTAYTLPPHISPDDPVRACYVVLVRNQELNGLLSSMRQLEDTFNRKFNYPYVFLNDDEFTPEFIEMTSAATKSQVKYGKLDSQMWGYPSFINQTLAAENREAMAAIGLPYGGSESYRHMCRYALMMVNEKKKKFKDLFPLILKIPTGSKVVISLDTLFWTNTIITGESNLMSISVVKWIMMFSNT